MANSVKTMQLLCNNSTTYSKEREAIAKNQPQKITKTQLL